MRLTAATAHRRTGPAPKAPRLPQVLLNLLAPTHEAGAMIGDLNEEYTVHIRPTRSRVGAELWYWWQVLASIGPTLSRRVSSARRTRRASASGGQGGGNRWRVMADLLNDISFALRGLISRPGFSVVALLTLALGVGASTAIFSVVNGVVLRPLPYHDPGRIARVHPDDLFMSNGMATYLAEQATSFETLAMWGRRTILLTGGDNPEEYRGGVVSTSHFDMLGVQPMLGRGFLTTENTEGADQVLILSHHLWTVRFGADPDIVGRELSLAGTPHTVIGVMGPQHLPIESDWQAWVPMNMDPDHWHRRSGTALNGRLRAGVTLEQAGAEMRRLTLAYSDIRGWGLTEDDVRESRVVPVREWMLGDPGQSLTLLLGAVGFVLLIACANVANLLLAQGSARRHEITVRLALGAKRGRVLRQLLTENLVLGLLGGGLGVVVALAGFRSSLAYLPADIPRVQTLSIDGTVLAFGLGLSLVSAMLFGVVPALRATGVSLATSLKDAGPAAGVSRARFSLNRGLVVAEVAGSVMLLIGAALMIRSFVRLQRVDPGFAAAGVVTVRPRLHGPRYQDDEAVLQYHRDVHAALAATPAVLAVGGINILPMTSGGAWTSYQPPDRPGDPEDQAESASYRIVSPGYLAAMGIPVVAGRPFDAGDRADAPPVILINQTLAREAWPDDDPVGRELQLQGEPAPFTVVGVVGDVRQSDVQTVVYAEVYLPLEQSPARRFRYAIRVDGDAGALLGTVRQVFRSVDSSLPLIGLWAMDDVVDRTVADERFLTVVLGAFGLVALCLGAIGVYGVMSYIVSRETREIGIRMALGARAKNVLYNSLEKALVPVAAGVVLGLAGALLTARVLESFLFEISSVDPLSFMAAPVILGILALLGAYVPARRASRVDPIQVLRGG
jgi:predicted permease